MNDQIDLTPVRFAALVAPAIDRVFPEMMVASRAMGGIELSRRYGGPAATGFLVDLRTRLSAEDGVITAAQFAAVSRYRDLEACNRTLKGQADLGMITLDEQGAIGATTRGREFLRDLYALHARVTAELWSGHEDRVIELVELAGRALAKAQRPEAQANTTDGHALSAMAPPFEPGDTPAGVRLLNRLSTLRYHRADAHAAAWQGAGLTAAQIAVMPRGAERARIENATNAAADRHGGP